MWRVEALGFRVFATEQIIHPSICKPVTNAGAINYFGLAGPFFLFSVLFVRVYHCGAMCLAPLSSMIAVSRGYNFRNLLKESQSRPLLVWRRKRILAHFKQSIAWSPLTWMDITTISVIKG